MVEFDAFAGDIALGGLRNMLEIKILVCYMLSRVKEPMSRKRRIHNLFTIRFAIFPAFTLTFLQKCLTFVFIYDKITNDI